MSFLLEKLTIVIAVVNLPQWRYSVNVLSLKCLYIFQIGDGQFKGEFLGHVTFMIIAGLII